MTKTNTKNVTERNIVKNYGSKQREYGKKTNWARQAKDHEKRREEINAKQRVENMTEEQKEKTRARNRSYYQKHKEKRKAYQAKRRAEKGDEIRKRQQELSKARSTRYGVPYRQVKLFAQAKGLSPKEAGLLLRENIASDTCAICGRTQDQIVDMGYQTRRGFHLDHIDGNNSNYELDNLQILCWKCNTTKLDLPLCERSSQLIKAHTDLYFTYFQKNPPKHQNQEEET